MIIISDASPLSALAEIGELELLHQMYGQIVIPETVRQECCHPHSPGALAPWFTRTDSWFLVVPDPVPLLPETGGVDAGEAAAISLAWQHRKDALLIMDDKDGRKLCDALGLVRTGTAGVLLAAAHAGLVDFESAVTRLQATTFRLSTAVLNELRSRL
ncbi:MAG: DUF3368 domain-containing protein [Prosthecobacter sp.]|uniref:DUF3368 domain-containing protein n=1 Tax=Prosthecobacter sp. TaxID=1965333 RepID=UPI0038FDF7B2